ncbi:hypothetical protein SASPL_151247 [Salvia splendens]|uniref:Uncharacterized protein n=1 Tax=Salvia splendens TaxID=180675 RepID=A0A8X8Z382_SALSN|nr:uncharacterized protein LOC121780979 [Salvia splendens]KAG6389773.1 hypothetical protein SASPL_151247 [Salvia splendens]
MEEQCSPLTWAYYFEEEGVADLKQSLFYSTLEVEAAVVAAHEEISRKDEEIVQLKELLANIMQERDEFATKCQRLSLEMSSQLQPISSGTTSNDDETNTNNSQSLSDSDSPPPADRLPVIKPLPENGKFLQAVMEAGPLLQTLLLAGPLPQWQHPPPQLSSGDIPPVTKMLISPTAGNKRSMLNSADFSPASKYQRICSPLNIISN